MPVAADWDCKKMTSLKKLVTKVNSIDIILMQVLIRVWCKYDTDKSELENKIPDTSSLVKKTDYNTKIAEIEGKTPDFNKLGTKTPLTAAENKIPDVLLKNRL